MAVEERTVTPGEGYPRPREDKVGVKVFQGKGREVKGERGNLERTVDRADGRPIPSGLRLRGAGQTRKRGQRKLGRVP